MKFAPSQKPNDIPSPQALWAISHLAVAKSRLKGAWQAFSTLVHTARALRETVRVRAPNRVRKGHVSFVGAGPGDPELLTLKALRVLQSADVIVHDRLVGPGVLRCAGPRARLINVGKEGFGASAKQSDINALIAKEAQYGAHVVRLKGGDVAVFGRLDEELGAVDAADLSWDLVPGITSASAASAAIGQSLTSRNRNSALRLLTGHDMRGFAEQEWSALTQPGEVAAIYMGKKAARYIQGRLLMHGAHPETPISIVENASCQNERVIATTLAELEPTLTHAKLSGPALLLYGLAPRTENALCKVESHSLQIPETARREEVL